jgi:hypothetical protein
MSPAASPRTQARHFLLIALACDDCDICRGFHQETRASDVSRPGLIVRQRIRYVSGDLIRFGL